MTNPTVDVRGAASMMNVHQQTVLDMIAAGDLPAARLGRSYVLLTRDVLAHIERAIQQQTAQRMGLVRKPHHRRAARSLPRRLA